MSDRLLKESDVLRIAFQLPLVVNSVFVDTVKALPSADRPQGEWKPKNHHTDYCSNCGFEETQWRTADYNYCPSCGARMKGVDDEHTV